MNLEKPQIWVLTERSGFKKYLEERSSYQSMPCCEFRNISEILAREEPDGGIVLVIDQFGKFTSYLPIVKRFQKRFISYDVVVFGKDEPEDVIQEEYLEGIDLHMTPEMNKEDIISRMNRIINLRSIKSSQNIIGRSQSINKIIDKIINVAPTEVSVLIEGESGTGKEVIAKTIHNLSHRAAKSFEEVNCGAFAEGVLESELFGHEKGAFTGAVAHRQGLLERADEGTIFLDEVGEMPLGMQVKLLRVLETGTFMRVGGMEKVYSNVRIIAATNKDLAREVERGNFRRDLYYRLQVIHVEVPPLRMRKEDIPLFVNAFLTESSNKHNKKIRGIEKEGYRLLSQYPWPGNVRELMNVIDNLVVMSSSSFIKASDIQNRLDEESQQQAFPDLPVHVQKSREEMEKDLIINSLLSLHRDVREILRLLNEKEEKTNLGAGRWIEVNDNMEEKFKDLNSIEKEAIREALLVNNGNRRKTAQQLGMSERTLYRRLKEYNID
ncbi:MAG TPA: sigma-54 dependent transcriptional regulator [Candidatus Krumholzibacteriaceae bacterium]|nr:sigma-54 dependent transcriptional regulator [Candidatus Krumholzibacteriaceae bacterium]